MNGKLFIIYLIINPLIILLTKKISFKAKIIHRSLILLALTFVADLIIIFV